MRIKPSWGVAGVELDRLIPLVGKIAQDAFGAAHISVGDGGVGVAVIEVEIAARLELWMRIFEAFAAVGAIDNDEIEGCVGEGTSVIVRLALQQPAINVIGVFAQEEGGDEVKPLLIVFDGEDRGAASCEPDGRSAGAEFEEAGIFVQD